MEALTQDRMRQGLQRIRRVASTSLPNWRLQAGSHTAWVDEISSNGKNVIHQDVLVLWMAYWNPTQELKPLFTDSAVEINVWP
jgi:hypothetical protein